MTYSNEGAKEQNVHLKTTFFENSYENETLSKLNVLNSIQSSKRENENESIATVSFSIIALRIDHVGDRRIHFIN